MFGKVNFTLGAITADANAAGHTSALPTYRKSVLQAEICRGRTRGCAVLNWMFQTNQAHRYLQQKNFANHSSALAHAHLGARKQIAQAFHIELTCTEPVTVHFATRVHVALPLQPARAALYLCCVYSRVDVYVGGFGGVVWK
jgi:hypothetical protein